MRNDININNANKIMQATIILTKYSNSSNRAEFIKIKIPKVDFKLINLLSDTLGKMNPYQNTKVQPKLFHNL